VAPPRKQAENRENKRLPTALAGSCLLERGEVIKVVIDTNVFVSSFFGGNPRKVIDLWKSGQIILCLSKDIVGEYVDMLKRFGLQNEDELEELLNLFAQGFHIIFTNKTLDLRLVEEDSGDDKFILP
jgi:putative PIN family toxin of toxin-antitoxin system